MADNETIADVLAAIRDEGRTGESSCLEWVGAKMRHYADRLEAAHKREHGDAAKLREALKHIKDRLPHMLQYMRVHWEDASAGGYFDELMLVINDALSTPPRNCDLPEVAKDPWRAWLDDKSNWDEFGSPKLEIHDWLLAPATEKEGGNDGNE